MNLRFNYGFPNDFVKVNQIEINKEYCFVSVHKVELEQLNTDGFIGVDLNTTSHVAVVANPSTGKVKKLGKKAYHVHKKYSNMRRQLQRQGKFAKLSRVKDRESRIVRDLNHKLSRTIVDEAKRVNKAIVLEDLTGIREPNEIPAKLTGNLHLDLGPTAGTVDLKGNGVLGETFTVAALKTAVATLAPVYPDATAFLATDNFVEVEADLDYIGG